jgi:SSS family solute:Na+ symporter
MASLVGGFALGMGRLVLELNREGLSGLLYTYATINFLNFAAILFVVCAAILVVVSLLTKPPSDDYIKGLTFATAAAGEPVGKVDTRTVSDPAWKRTDFRLSLLVVLVVAVVMVYFSSLFFP